MGQLLQIITSTEITSYQKTTGLDSVRMSPRKAGTLRSKHISEAQSRIAFLFSSVGGFLVCLGVKYKGYAGGWE